MSIPIDALTKENQNAEMGNWLGVLCKIKEEINCECMDDESRVALHENNEPKVKTDSQNTSFECRYFKDEYSWEEILPNNNIELQQNDVKILASGSTDVAVLQPGEFYIGQPVQPTNTAPINSANLTKCVPDFEQKIFLARNHISEASEFASLKAIYSLASISIGPQNTSTPTATLDKQQFGNSEDSYFRQPRSLPTLLQPKQLQMHCSQASRIDTVNKPAEFVKQQPSTGETFPESRYFHQPIQYVQVTKLPLGTKDFIVSPAQICLYEGSRCAIQLWTFYNDQNQSSEKMAAAHARTTEVNKTKPKRFNRKQRSLSSKDINQLKEAFNENKYPDKLRRDFLASALNLTSDRIKRWFAYERSKLRRKEKLSHEQATKNKKNLGTLCLPAISDVWLPVPRVNTKVDTGLYEDQ